MDAEIHRSEIPVKGVFPGFVKAGGRIDQKYPLIHIHKVPLPISGDYLKEADVRWLNTIQTLFINKAFLTVAC